MQLPPTGFPGFICICDVCNPLCISTLSHTTETHTTSTDSLPTRAKLETMQSCLKQRDAWRSVVKPTLGWWIVCLRSVEEMKSHLSCSTNLVLFLFFWPSKTWVMPLFSLLLSGLFLVCFSCGWTVLTVSHERGDIGLTSCHLSQYLDRTQVKLETQSSGHSGWKTV